MVPSLVDHPQSIITRNRLGTCLLSVGPGQVVGLGHFSVLQLVHSLPDLLPIGLDVCHEHECGIFSCGFYGDTMVMGNLTVAWWSRLFFVCLFFLRIFGLPQEAEYVGSPEG